MGKIQFKYHPNIYEDDVLVHKSGICQCCGKQISEYIEHIYSAEDVDCICLQCVS
ncbi:MAG: CbrC family protein, partial [Clostridiales bacterium]|nr:CbrC family protein [Clostridiales bacterium]